MQNSKLWSWFPARTHMKEDNATVCTNFTYLYHALLGITLLKFLLPQSNIQILLPDALAEGNILPVFNILNPISTNCICAGVFAGHKPC